MYDKKSLNIIKHLSENGYEAYYAGGCVRDSLLDREPHDYDIVTNATPDQIEIIFECTVGIGKSFGVIGVIIDHELYDVATFRSEGEYSDGRHPNKVSFCTAEEDAARRDFTINGMFYDPLTNKIIDYVGGRNGIDTEMIMCIGDPDKRMEEDYLRMLRAIRFAVTLGFEIEHNTFMAIKNNADNIGKISKERICDELKKMLSSKRPYEAVMNLMQTGLMKHILPVIKTLIGVEQPKQWHPEGDVFNHTLNSIAYYQSAIMEGLFEPDYIVALAVLLHDIGKPSEMELIEGTPKFKHHAETGAVMVKEILTNLKFDNKTIETISHLVGNHMKFMVVQKMRKSTLKRFVRLNSFSKLLQVHYCDAMGSCGDLSEYEFCKSLKFELEEIRPELFVTGSDLIELGYKPGKIFKTILTEAENLQLEGIQKAGILDYIKRNYKNE